MRFSAPAPLRAGGQTRGASDHRGMGRRWRRRQPRARTSGSWRWWLRPRIPGESGRFSRCFTLLGVSGIPGALDRSRVTPNRRAPPRQAAGGRCRSWLIPAARPDATADGPQVSRAPSDVKGHFDGRRGARWGALLAAGVGVAAGPRPARPGPRPHGAAPYLLCSSLPATAMRWTKATRSRLRRRPPSWTTAAPSPTTTRSAVIIGRAARWSSPNPSPSTLRAAKAAVDPDRLLNPGVLLDPAARPNA
jgi:hypothetical protein